MSEKQKCDYLSAASHRLPCLAHYKSTGDLSDSTTDSLSTSPNTIAPFMKPKTSGAFLLGTPPRPSEFRLNSNSRQSRRSTTILQFPRSNDSPKTLNAFDGGKVSGSLADIQQFHASFNRHHQPTSIEEEDDSSYDLYFSRSVLCYQNGPPMLCMKGSFASMSSSSSIESNNPPMDEQKPPIVERKNAIAIKTMPNQRIPNVKLHPASPSVERAALKWTRDNPQTKAYRKMSDVAHLSTEDECYAGGRRRSLSKSPTRVPDQILLEKLNSPTQTDQPPVEQINPTADIAASLEWAKLPRFPSLRKKKSKSWKKDDSSSLISQQDRKRLSNTLLFDSAEQKIEGWANNPKMTLCNYSIFRIARRPCIPLFHNKRN
jgi:hypothetical protein